ncbi:TonB family protein [Aquirufa sp. ROCK2-A2]
MTNNLPLIYLAKSVLLSGIFYGYYLLVLRNKRFHTYNRFYLIISLILSFIIPFFNFTYLTGKQEVLSQTEKAVYFLSTVTIKAQQSPWLDEHWMELLTILLGSVSFILFSYLCFQIYSVFQLKNKYQGTRLNDIYFIETEDENAPFSFFNHLFWKKSIDLNSENGQAIFTHEITHIEQKHSYDRIFCQVMSSIFWMNPFTWIIQNELQNIHEFIADEKSFGQGNAETLAKIVLQTHYGNHFFNPSHSFYYSSIKRRIIMLTTSQNPKHSYLRKVLALPLLAGTVFAFSMQLSAQTTEKTTSKESTLAVAPSKQKRKTSSNASLPIPPTPPITPLMVIDGKIEEKKGMNDIKPNEIESMNVLKGALAKEKYGKLGKNGVIEITSKKNAAAPSDSPSNDQIIPEYPGGMEAFVSYLNKNLKYPEDAKKAKVTGKVYVEINVNAEGTLTNVKILKTPGYGFGEEAVRVMKESGKWIPAKKNHVNIASSLVLPIQFLLSE